MRQQDLRDGVPKMPQRARQGRWHTAPVWQTPCLALFSYPLYKSLRAAKTLGDRNTWPHKGELARTATLALTRATTEGNTKAHVRVREVRASAQEVYHWCANAPALRIAPSDAGARVECQSARVGSLTRVLPEVFAGKTWNHPVIAHGKLFVRNGAEAACYQLVEENRHR